LPMPSSAERSFLAVFCPSIHRNIDRLSDRFR
jgi:hypothetical protein